jgi:hypothetical protein
MQKHIFAFLKILFFPLQKYVKIIKKWNCLYRNKVECIMEIGERISKLRKKIGTNENLLDEQVLITV